MNSEVAEGRNDSGYRWTPVNHAAKTGLAGSQSKSLIAPHDATASLKEFGVGRQTMSPRILMLCPKGRGHMRGRKRGKTRLVERVERGFQA